jgi:hypothetical protein
MMQTLIGDISSNRNRTAWSCADSQARPQAREKNASSMKGRRRATTTTPAWLMQGIKSQHRHECLANAAVLAFWFDDGGCITSLHL